MSVRRLPGVAVAVAIVVALLGACGQGGTEGRTEGGKLAVVASFYPLQFAIEQVGGGHIAVTTLTKPGAEPHDVELTPRDVATVSKARLVVYEKGL